MKAQECAFLSESQLEAFLMERLPAQMDGSIYHDSVARVEDHLLICPRCLDSAETHNLLLTALYLERAQTSNGQSAAALPEDY